MHAIILAAIYGTLVSTNAFKAAPYAVNLDGWTRVTATLPEADANRAGYKLLVDEPPVTDTNHYAVAVGYTEDTRIRRAYEVRENPPAPARRYYKYDLSVAAMEYGQITNLIEFVSADVGTKWMWDAAEILVATDPYFVAATNAVISAGVIDEKTAKAILDRAYELGQTTEAAND